MNARQPRIVVSAARQTLLPEFEAGRLARIEGAEPSACPFYATSHSADAWHAGFAFESPIIDPRTERLTALPQRMTVAAVSHGRGYLVNVIGRDMCANGTPTIQRQLHVAYDRNGAARVTLAS